MGDFNINLNKLLFNPFDIAAHFIDKTKKAKPGGNKRQLLHNCRRINHAKTFQQTIQNHCQKASVNYNIENSVNDNILPAFFHENIYAQPLN